MYTIIYKYKDSIDSGIHYVNTSSLRFCNDMKKDTDLEIIIIENIKEINDAKF